MSHATLPDRRGPGVATARGLVRPQAKPRLGPLAGARGGRPLVLHLGVMPTSCRMPAHNRVLVEPIGRVARSVDNADDLDAVGQGLVHGNIVAFNENARRGT